MSIREQKKQQTKRAILEAAITLFSEHGFEATSIEQIAKAAGVGKGTVYGYFQTKREIIRGFCEYELEHIHEELVRRANPDASLLDQMVTIYMTEFKHVTRNREFGRLYMREAIFPNDDDVTADQDLNDKYFQMLFPILERAKMRGELREEIELLHITGHFYGLFILILHAWYTGRIPSNEIEKVMMRLFRQLLEGLSPNTNVISVSE